MANEFIIKNGFRSKGDSQVTGSLDVTVDVTASAFKGDGSALTNLPSSDPFPYTGSAIISGSLEVEGDTRLTGSLTISGSEFNILNKATDPGSNSIVRLGRSEDVPTAAGLRIQTNAGYTDIGVGNVLFTHFYTSAPRFYFNEPITVEDGNISSYNEDLTLQRGYNNTQNQIILGTGVLDVKLGNTNILNISSSNIISGSATSTASFGTYLGDGSQLTNLPSSSPFPFTGSAIISGSLEVEGDTRLTGSLLISGSNISFGGTTTSTYPKIDFPNSINIGNNTVMHTSSFGDVVIGQNASTEYGSTYLGTQRRVAIGYNADINGAGSVAIGHGATVGSTEGVAIGYSSETTAYRGTAIGYDASAGSAGVAIGAYSSTGGSNSAAILGTTSGANSVTLGGAAGLNGVAVGKSSSAATNAVALGQNADATGTGAVAIGPSILSSGLYAISIGTRQYGGSQFENPSGSSFAIYHNDATPTFFLHKDENSYYNSSGNFGFNTLTPTATLTVSGSTDITGSFKVTGSADFSDATVTGITATAGSTSGRVVFTTTDGALTTENGFDYNSTTNQLTVESLNVVNFTSSFITSSTIESSGSHIFGDSTSDTQILVGTIKMSGSAELTGSLDVTGDITASAFKGDGSALTNLPAAATPTLQQVTTAGAATTNDIQITGSLTISGSFSAFTLDSDNIVLGAGAGTNMLAGADSNVVLGNNAGATLTTGDFNVIVGHGADVNSAAHSYVTAIGHGAKANQSNIAIGYNVEAIDNDGMVAIGSSAGAALTTVVGRGSSTTGYGSQAFGYNVDSTATTAMAFGYNLTNALAGSFQVGSGAQKLTVTTNSNLLLNKSVTPTAATHFDDSATNVITIGTGSAPDANVGSSVQLYAQTGSSEAGLQLRTSGGKIYTIADTIDFTDATSLTVTNITSSGAISASGNLFADIADNSSTSLKTVMYDTSTGKLFRTGSYGGGGGGSSTGAYGIPNSDGVFTYYTDLSSSLQAASSGDTIQLFTTVTESANHSYHLKDGVNFNFNGNELFYETTTSSGLEIFTDNGAQVTCSFYNGKIRFNQPGNGTNNLIKMTGAGTQINSVGFEWEIMEGTSYAIYLQASNSALDGGKFTANVGYSGVLIRHYYTEIRNVEIVTYGASVTYSYGFNDTTSNFPRVKNSTIYGYFDNVENKSLFTQITGLHLIGNFIYLRGKSTGTKSKVSSGGTEFIGNVIDTKNASGIICASSIGNTIFVETGDFGLTVSSEVVGGSIDILSGQALITANEVTSGVRVTGLSIRCKEFGGAAAELGTNTSLMGCDLFDDYGNTDAKLVEIKTGCTGVEIANCTFDFMNTAGRVGNIGITAVDNGTVVKFANNTIMGGTLFNPTKVTQGILNTPDAQGNMSMTF